MNLVIVSQAQISETLVYLKAAGKRRSECVVLWLGRRREDGIVVERVWCPPHRAGRAFFEFSEEAMAAMFAELRKSRQMIAAQVHSHPMEAFHSAADDHWAIVRHEGALSLVVPYFARHTVTDSFVVDMAAFVLTSDDRWTAIESEKLENHLTIR
ncbi:MAG TPA: Mov34/MPN/PAD-1 family protein [Opitutaceae bacterium]|nr:Mov34/MPN/PAD-1 family protein [Opitutaceae bacterium]